MNETVNTGSFGDLVEQAFSSAQAEPSASESAPIKKASPKYFWANGIPGSGERPDYLIEKYKTVEDQAKAYKAAQPLLGRVKDLEGIIGAPESYAIPEDFLNDELVKKYTEFSKKNNFNQAFFDQGLELFKEARTNQPLPGHVKDLEGIIGAPESYSVPEEFANDELVKKYSEFSKKNNFNQAFFDQGLELFKEARTKALVSHEAEMKKLGDNGQERVQVLSQWVKNHFPPDVFNALKDIPFKAEVVNFFEGVKSMTTQSTVPTGIPNTQATPDSMNRIREDLAKNYKEVRSNPEFAKEIMERMNKAGARPIEKR